MSKYKTRREQVARRSRVPFALSTVERAPNRYLESAEGFIERNHARLARTSKSTFAIQNLEQRNELIDELAIGSLIQ